ncbi:hypothetical protein ABFA07_004382 [Porites harrisoni]
MARHRLIFTFATLYFFSEFSQCSADNEDSFAWNVKDSTEFGVAESNIEDTILDVDLSSKITFRYQTTDGGKIYVFDNILHPKNLHIFSRYLNIDLGAWQFSLYEPYDGGIEKPTDNIPWINDVDCIEFSKSVVGKTMQKAVMDTAQTEDIYYPYKVKGKLVRRGDFTKLFTDANKTDDEYSAFMFLNPTWRKNDYGELYLYDEDNEIMAGTVPKFGRVVVWPSSVSYLARPPSMAFKKGQLILHVQFTKSKQKILASHRERMTAKGERQVAYDAGFIGSDKPAPTGINIAQHRVSEHSSTEGKKIFVFDDLFDKEDLDRLRAFIFKHGTYYYDDSDDGDDGGDNVQWIAGFEINDYIQSRLWNIMQQTLKHLTGSDKWFPYDISCNLIRSADHTRIHQDCEYHEDEWTYLIYLTPNWTKNDYGETAFYETMSHDNEIITEVRPKYGRAVVFQGIIPHSARPPSTNQSHARLTFVAKVSVDEFVGRRKAFKEEMKHFTGVLDTRMRLNSMEQGKGAELTGEHDREHGEEKETEDMEGQSRNRDKPQLENESEEEEGEGDGHEDEDEERD